MAQLMEPGICWELLSLSPAAFRSTSRRIRPRPRFLGLIETQKIAEPAQRSSGRISHASGWAEVRLLGAASQQLRRHIRIRARTSETGRDVLVAAAELERDEAPRTNVQQALMAVCSASAVRGRACVLVGTSPPRFFETLSAGLIDLF